MREDTAEQYLAYKLIDSNQDWKAKWFYITNHHPELSEAKWEAPEASALVEHGADDAGGH
jgi:hypothetical protein